jgi:hypothetical protein
MPPCRQTLTTSASAYFHAGGQGKWALWQFCPTTEESLKNALVYNPLPEARNPG